MTSDALARENPRQHRPAGVWTPRVWAPLARNVELVLASGERHPMVRADELLGAGWHVAPGVDLAGADRYGFSLDHGPARADPRSASQPCGPEGLSEVIDHHRFEWSDLSWRGFHLASAVIYELHVGTFSQEGTFDAVATRLDHLVDLGITAIELMPVAEFPGERGWGYDGVNLYAAHHAYGGPDALKRLVDACHKRGLAVILDVVYNHLGPSGNYLGEFGPYFTDRHQTPWGQAINFDGPGSDEVRRFVTDNAVQWLADYHLDGLRLDAVHAIFDSSAVHILEQLASTVAELSAATGWRRWLVAESDLNDPRIVKSCQVGGFGLDAQWLDDFHHSLHCLITGERGGYYSDFGRVEDLATSLQHGYVYSGRYSAVRDRSHGRTTAGLAGWSFVGFAQNHDHVGNRAVGDRLSANVSVGSLKIAAALTILAPFIPMVFQGEEWAASTPFAYFTDHTDRALGDAVREGRRNEFASFGWDPLAVPDPQDPATFEASRLRWDETDQSEHRDVLEWYRSLIRLRRSVPELADGRMDRVRFSRIADSVFTVSRGPVLLAVNLSAAHVAVALDPPHDTMPAARIALASQGECDLRSGKVELPAESAAVVITPTGVLPAETSVEPPAVQLGPVSSPAKGDSR